MWTMAHRLYELVGQIEPAPSDLVESPWIRTREVAVQKMFDWLRWMGAVNVDGTPANVVAEPKRRMTFKVPYSVAKDYHLCKHIHVQFPHQTENQLLEALVEMIQHNLRENTTTLRIILYRTTSAIEYFVQDTYGNGSQPDWQDTWEEQSIHGEGPDTQDSY